MPSRAARLEVRLGVLRAPARLQAPRHPATLPPPRALPHVVLPEPAVHQRAAPQERGALQPSRPRADPGRSCSRAPRPLARHPQQPVKRVTEYHEAFAGLETPEEDELAHQRGATAPHGPPAAPHGQHVGLHERLRVERPALARHPPQQAVREAHDEVGQLHRAAFHVVELQERDVLHRLPVPPRLGPHRGPVTARHEGRALKPPEPLGLGQQGVVPRPPVVVQVHHVVRPARPPRFCLPPRGSPLTAPLGREQEAENLKGLGQVPREVRVRARRGPAGQAQKADPPGRVGLHVCPPGPGGLRCGLTRRGEDRHVVPVGRQPLRKGREGRTDAPAPCRSLRLGRDHQDPQAPPSERALSPRAVRLEARRVG